ncbi:50S ribosomal protein L23 [Candidatus Enterovibrio escicola]|uniref:Large ribosomal subunit protein uL23 n=1 Tax=Candidatus Enterovibrio escicola TaxID=1927127 RepID=A0A2A5T1X6_9GAMM|nr:50S ribosomal protein L23 [Candidatus Enterovibrio escacola]PCS22173.1 LSU ribosomal protein L23p (L23Ae) [Candidatus Enterovibrio escacola]
MITEERILQVLRAPHISEKATMVTEKYNAIVFKVAMTATKKEIKMAVETLFEVEVKSVNTLISKGKIKRSGSQQRRGQGRGQGRRNDSKKAYVFLKGGQGIDFAGGTE